MPPGEALAMEPHQVTFSRRSGVLLTWRRGLLLLLLVAGCLLATGLLVHHLGRPASSETSASRADSVTSDDAGTSREPLDDIRLPRHLAPEAYSLRMLPLFEEGNFSFSGEVTVTLRADAAGGNVTLHVSELVVDNDSVSVTDVTETRSVSVDDLREDAEREFLVVRLAEPVVPGHRYNVTLKFSGVLNDKLAGFYRSSYVTPQGEKRWMAVTQFSPNDARKAFPCLDEPALKATFEITMGRHEQMTSISNMPLSMTTPNQQKADFVWDAFEKSLPMSTYVVGFIVTDMASREADPALSETRFKVWSRPDAIEHTEYARKIGPVILEYFEDFFKTEFPLPKLDMAAIPDFPFGGMENWGLITYRETAMLFDPVAASAANKQRVAKVVAHELAHMWFGDLATPSWWTDLWLKEGFANYMVTFGIQKVEPSWRMHDQVVTGVMQSVMAVDGLRSSHAISIPVKKPDDIGQIFDKISYDKGNSIIRMLDHMLTTETLRNALANYLKAMQYKAATQDDLWRFLTEQAHRDGTLPADISVKQVMDTWTLQMGFPVVTVSRNYPEKSAQLTQNRFLFGGADNSTEFLWWVPLVFTTETKTNFNSTQPTHWMRKERHVTINDMADAEEWVILNVQEMGFFKVNYDQKNWELLIKQLQGDHTVVHPINRAQLVDDALDLARAGHLGYDTALSVISYLEREHDFLPWNAAFANLDFLNIQLRRTPGYGTFQQFVLRLITPLYERIGFEERSSDSHLDHLTRNKVLSWACWMGHSDCLSKAVSMFKLWMDSPDNTSIIPANIRSRVYCSALSEGGLAEWEFTWGRFNESTVESERQKLLKALACTKQIWLLNRLLSWLTTPGSGLRVHHGLMVFQAVASNAMGRYLAWDFIRNNFPDIVEIYGGALFTLPKFIATLKEGFNTALDLKQLQLFANEHEESLGEAKRAMQQVLEHSTASVAWMEEKYDKVVTWLDNQTQDADVK